MSRQNDAAPIIIKRKKIVVSGGHHGGAWKVAYADFVTAMMAFFLMMWLLGATTESQRRGLADYFNPTIPVHRISSGGDGMFGGTDLETRQQMGPTTPPEQDAGESGQEVVAEAESFEEAETRLMGMGGESAILTEALRHVITRQTDQGLVIELFDLPDMALFIDDTDQPAPVLSILAPVLVQVLSNVTNTLSVEGHTRTYSMVQATDPRWPLSSARAHAMRQLLQDADFAPDRIARVTGHADRRLSVENPMAVRNNRLELILLRRAPQTPDRR
jgi:chemotaxis protein MotB